MKKTLFIVIAIMALIAAMVVSSSVAAGSSGDIANVSITSSSITWTPTVSNLKSVTLTITGPDSYYFHKQYGGSAAPSISNSGLKDGSYSYELVLAPKSSQSSGDQSTRGVNSESSDLTQSGAFAVRNGAFVKPKLESGQPSSSTSSGGLSAQDVVYTDDLIVQQSLCVGTDCVNGESFGFDTIRIKENNTRIKFDDTSTSSGFPNNDWTIVANDSASGGSNYLAFEDTSGGKTPFKVMAGAKTNALFVSSSSRVGLGTSTPVVELHIVDGDTPTVRLEQNGSSGWTAQTWDVAGNETNFFVRDVTNGSKLPFKIKPSAPTNSLFVAANGDLGIGTGSPSQDLDVRDVDGSGAINIGTGANSSLNFATNNTTQMTLDTSGNLGIGITSPTETVDIVRNGSTPTFSLRRTDGGGAQLRFSSTLVRGKVGTINNIPLAFTTNDTIYMELDTSGNLSVTGNVSATAFNTTSDKNAKENFAPVNSANVLDRLANMPISTWNFIANDNKTLHMGPMAQDFYAAFGLGTDDKHIATVDADGVAFAAIQELNNRNQALSSENASLRSQIDDLAARVSALEGGTTPNQPSQDNTTVLIILLVVMNLGLGGFLVWSIRRGSLFGVKPGNQ